MPRPIHTRVELLEREVCSAARVITGCLVSTPFYPLLAKAEMVPVRVRCELLAARLFCTAASHRRDNPLRTVSEAKAPRRLLTATGWRDTSSGALARAGAEGVLVEERLHVTIPPWMDG